jgi:hypothetical protein
MYYVYGSYRSGNNEFTPRWSERIALSDRGQPMKKTVSCTLDGRKIGSSASITSQMLALQQAFSFDNRNLTIFDDDNNRTIYEIVNDRTFSGVKVIEPPHIPEARGADYATSCPYRVTLQAEFLVSAPDSTFNFTESIDIDGGGPLVTMLITSTGDPIPQIVARKTPFVARQAGSFSSYSPLVPLPLPKWPAARVDSRVPRITRSIEGGTGIFMHQYQWDYEFLSVAPLQ